jgi:hypothetical protein
MNNNIDHENTTDAWDGILGVVAPKKAPKPENTRPLVAEVIRKAAPDLIKHNNGLKLLAASTVMKGLQALELECPARLQQNFVGDCLGGHGLDLPRVSLRGKKRYAIHMVNASAEEKAAFQAGLDALTPEQRKALKAA